MQQPHAEHQERLVVGQHERPVGERPERRNVMSLRAGPRVEPLGVQSIVDRIGPVLPRVQLLPDLDEPNVVLATTERARAVPGSERGRLVEEEQFRELPRLHERRPVPAAELQPARDPSPNAEEPPDAAVLVVHAPAIAVDEPPSRVGDRLTERGDSVLQRHRRYGATSSPSSTSTSISPSSRSTTPRRYST